MHIRYKALLTLLFITSWVAVFAQKNGAASRYNPHDFFLEKYYPPTANEFRSAKGVPGYAYWQNSADYVIRATLNEKENTVTGEVEITYTNNSPDPLDYLWLHMDQNIFSPGSRGANTAVYPGDNSDVTGEPNGGFKTGDITVSQGETNYAAHTITNDTRMQVFLKKPMEPKGGKITIKMNFHFAIPQDGAGRFGKQSTRNGVIYQIAQWYPRMSVYDDVRGWNTLPYLGYGEFYLDYGNFDYYITAPAEMFVFGSGDLQNPSDVLTGEQIKRLEKASNSDQTVMIVAANETRSPSIRPVNKGNLTWHFKMDNTREIAWAAGKGMIWDAARVNVPSGKKVMAMSAYPIESDGKDAWGRSTEYLKASMEFYSKQYFEYPWNTAVSSAGITDGMEYPGMIFDHYKEKGARLWFLIAHEIGHNWYPHIVGSNERRYMWQDESINTFINHLATERFNKGEYLNAPEFQKKTFFGLKDYEQFMQSRDPLMIPPDAVTTGQHNQYYGRGAYALDLLRNVIIGKERFDSAFLKYTQAWAFKHPTPYDFFNCMNNVSGEDLSWFWHGWFFTNWKLDQAVKEVKYVDGNPAKGAYITVENLDKMIMPVIIRVEQENGQVETKTLPVEMWQRGADFTIFYPSKSNIKKVWLDPEKVLPDMNRSNNEWRSR